ncbi:MAG: cation-transporting P-type ATPase, partial [Bacteroidales bacterium]|nr:cation-transporting P-type ATPase [Bacteroidales bacterium]
MNGQNIIPPAEKQPLWKGYLEKFKDPIIMILLVAFMLSLALAIYEQSQGAGNVVLLEPLGVLFALLLATGIGFWFEVKADREFDVLNKVIDTVPVKVFREHWCEIPKCDVEAGDLVKLESGDEVPADGTLEEALALRVDESAFTGEPYTQKTTEQELFQQNATYPSNFLLRGSVVLEGTALLCITAIGLDTEEGRGVMKTR